MALLKYVKPEEAQGEVAQAYGMFQKTAGMVPLPFQMTSVSPQLMNVQLQSIGYMMGHANLKPELLAYIRYIVAAHLGFDWCINFNGKALQSMGQLDEGQVAAVLNDPEQAQLDDKDKALLKLAVKAALTPREVGAEEVEALRAMGWTDQDIFDASWQAAGMAAYGSVFQAFQMDQP